jgi:hypothetical protein
MSSNFGEKTYICCCHGCGAIHEKISYFLSVPMMIGMPTLEDGTTWVLPALGCPACMEKGKKAQEEAKALGTFSSKARYGPVARAFDNGMTPEARENANQQFEIWLPRLLANKAKESR